MTPNESENESDATSPEETHREAAALNHLLGEIGLSSNEKTTWWNLVAHAELGNRTATQAWLVDAAPILTPYHRSKTDPLS